MRCMICGNELKACICPRCGFDLSLCAERYPTFFNRQPASRALCLERDELYRELLDLRSALANHGGRRRQRSFEKHRIAAGNVHTVFVQSDGTVCATGWNFLGQCSVSNWTNIISVAAGGNHTVGLLTDGTVCAAGNNLYGQCAVSEWRGIRAIAAGGYHLIGLCDDGRVCGAGSNKYGQLQMDDWTDVAEIAAGDYHSVALRSDGIILAVGKNNEGQCDVSDWNHIIL